MKCQASKDLSPQAYQARTISRRQLLKALIASGGAVTAATLLPCEWRTPVVEVGVLPAHAQVSPTTTPTTVPRGAIIGCYTLNANGSGNIGASDTSQTYAAITHPVNRQGVMLRRTITLDQGGHPMDGVVSTDIGPTDSQGEYHPPDFDLRTLSPPISAGQDRITVLWEFFDPNDGTNDCENGIDIV